MAVETVTVSLAVPKEIKEVIDVLAHALDLLVVQKKPASELVALLPELVTAVDGIQKLSEEIKDVHRREAVAYLPYKIGPIIGL